jgi:large subunit ribosomal protein L28e
MSADIQWLIIRNNSSFLMKRKHMPTLSKEPHNLKGRNSFRYNGLVQKKTVGIEPASSGKGIVLVTRNSTSARKPAKNHTRVELKRNSRKTLKTISQTLFKGRYRQDLKMCAVRRASAILRSQKPVIVKKARTGPKKKE